MHHIDRAVFRMTASDDQDVYIRKALESIGARFEGLDQRGKGDSALMGKRFDDWAAGQAVLREVRVFLLSSRLSPAHAHTLSWLAPLTLLSATSSKPKQLVVSLFLDPF